MVIKAQLQSWHRSPSPKNYQYKPSFIFSRYCSPLPSWTIQPPVFLVSQTESSSRIILSTIRPSRNSAWHHHIGSHEWSLVRRTVPTSLLNLGSCLGENVKNCQLKSLTKGEQHFIKPVFFFNQIFNILYWSSFLMELYNCSFTKQNDIMNCDFWHIFRAIYFIILLFFCQK